MGAPRAGERARYGTASFGLGDHFHSHPMQDERRVCARGWDRAMAAAVTRHIRTLGESARGAWEDDRSASAAQGSPPADAEISVALLEHGARRPQATTEVIRRASEEQGNGCMPRDLHNPFSTRVCFTPVFLGPSSVNASNVSWDGSLVSRETTVKVSLGAEPPTKSDVWGLIRRLG